MPDDTVFRDEVFACAPSDWRHAMAVVEQIDETWFRVQAMAACAKHAPTDVEARQLIEQAWRLAVNELDRYTTVAGSAWIIHAAIHRAMGDLAHVIISAAMELSPEISPLKSRCRALGDLWQAAIPLGSHVSDHLLNSAAAAAVELCNSPQRRTQGIGRSELAHLILKAASCSPLAAERLLQQHPDQKRAARLRARIAAGEVYPPRTRW